MELTQDSSIIIVHRQHNVIVYYRYEDNRSWIVVGKCNESNCDSKRMELDCPVTPELKCQCGLKGLWVN